MIMSKVEKLKEYFTDNPEELLSVCLQINSYDGSMDDLDSWDLEELCDKGPLSSYEIARAIIYGDVKDTDNPVKFNGYENLETVTEEDLMETAEDYLDDAVDILINRKKQYGIVLDPFGELQEILDAEEEYEEE